MLLHTPSYLIFLSLTAIIYWRLPESAARKWLLVAASFLFYLLFSWQFCLLLIALILVTYFAGMAIPGSSQPKLYFYLHLAFSLCLLGYLKYSAFFIDSVMAGLHLLGIATISPTIQIVLPIGISFYTFQAIGYIIEIYYARLAPSRNLIDVALLLGFFPKLIAGPLVRPNDFLSQIQSKIHKLTNDDLQSAIGLMIFGLVKKVLIADCLCAQANTAFMAARMASNAAIFPTPLYLQGFYLYAFQIYADFSGYTDIARASALFLGIKLPENFHQPYWSTTVGEFWYRWHMSLTQWFREYLFFPLSRWLLVKSQRHFRPLIQATAILLTMVLIGLWHGASWTFIAWGLWHGILLTMDSLLRIRSNQRVQRMIGGLITFHLIGIGWILFRSDSFQTAEAYYQGILNWTQLNWLGYYMLPVVFVGLLVFFIDFAQSGKVRFKGTIRDIAYQTEIISGVLILLVLCLLSYVHGSNPLPFIYGIF